jgi:hypothetical protein
VSVFHMQLPTTLSSYEAVPLLGVTGPDVARVEHHGCECLPEKIPTGGLIILSDGRRASRAGAQQLGPCYQHAVQIENRSNPSSPCHKITRATDAVLKLTA